MKTLRGKPVPVSRETDREKKRENSVMSGADGVCAKSMGDGDKLWTTGNQLLCCTITIDGAEGFTVEKPIPAPGYRKGAPNAAY